MLFNVMFFSWTALICIGALPVAPFMKQHHMRRYAQVWMRGVHWLLAVCVGLHHRIVGLENLPAGPVLFASKHQSAWETMIFNCFRTDIVVGLKHELTKIPIFGWYLVLAGNIKIDRGRAANALRSLVKGAKSASASGLSVLVFPEGTRQAPDAPPAYKPGVAALYAALDVPCVPVALNSGLFWGRNAALKRPGIITLEILEPIPPGLDRKAFMQLLEDRIETASVRLRNEARSQH